METKNGIGTVLDGAGPLSFPFKIAKDLSIPLHEYVSVNVQGKTVLAEVVGVGARNPLARENIADYTTKDSGIYGYEVAVAEVLGYLENGKIMRPKYAPKPNTPVYLADTKTLQNFYNGDDGRLPIHVGTLIHRNDVKVPIHVQDLSFHLGVFAQTRGGKSYLAGAIMENILLNTNFPVIVIDVHGDYVMMDRSVNDDKKHGKFNVVVYYPPKAPHMEGVTAETKDLKISLRQMTSEGFLNLIGGLGELQTILVKQIIKDLMGQKREFGLRDVADKIEQMLRDEESDLSSEDRKRLSSVLMRLEDLEEDVEIPPEGTPVQEFLRPKTLNVICLRGLSSRIQEAYTGILVDLIYRNNVSNFGDLKKAPPVFIFVEEAHRVAAESGSPYSSKVISKAIREGAKFGVFMALISQRPRSISQDVMANLGNYAVLRITNAQDQNMIESASESFSHRLIEDLPALNQGEAVLVGPFVPLPAIVKVSNRMTVHYGATPNLSLINSKISKMIEEATGEKW